MIRPAKSFSADRARRLQSGIVSWRVGPADQPDTLRTGRLVRIEGEQALVQPSEEAAQRWIPVADLEGGAPELAQRPGVAEPKPAAHPALDLPAPVAESLELLGLLDQGVEVLPGQRTVLAPILAQLVQRGFLTDCGHGRWQLTAKGQEVLHG